MRSENLDKRRMPAKDGFFAVLTFCVFVTAASMPAVAGMVTPRSIDGSDNNQSAGKETQGAADTQIIRFSYDLTSFYPGDGSGSTMLTSQPNARVISNALSQQSGSVPNARGLSDYVWQWGQFLTHDLDLTTNNAANNGAENTNIIAPAGDPAFAPGAVIPFNRSDFDPATGDSSSNFRDQVNLVTSYIDASNVYGSGGASASGIARDRALRTDSVHTGTSGEGAFLKMSNGGLLGLNDAANAADRQANDNATGMSADTELFLAGDVRANEQPGLTALHTIFAREHNRLATRIQNAGLFEATDEESVYQLARKLVGAEMQAITYNEFLPAIMGETLAPKASDISYSSSVDASITQTFSHALFRFGHSMTSSTLKMVEADGTVSAPVSLASVFFNPDFLKGDTENVNRILRGLASQAAQENDLLFVEELRSMLFGPPTAGGLDLMALDIQRGRDHGLPNYSSMSDFYGGIPEIDSFDDIPTDAATRAALIDLYGMDNLDQIDLFVGALAEEHFEGTSLGFTMLVVIGNQFQRLRDGDRFFYLIDNDLYDQTTGLLREDIEDILDLDTITLSDIIRFNTGVQLQEDVFFVPEPTTGLVFAVTGLIAFCGYRRRSTSF